MTVRKHDEFDYNTQIITGEKKLFITVSSKLLRNYLRMLLKEFQIDEYKEKYKSKYNDFVCYDHEPFCIDGFKIIFNISFNKFDQLRFLNWIVVNRLKKFIELEKQFDIDIDLRTKEGKLISKIKEA